MFSYRTWIQRFTPFNSILLSEPWASKLKPCVLDTDRVLFLDTGRDVEEISTSHLIRNLQRGHLSLPHGGRPKNFSKYNMTNIFVPLLTLSHPKVIRPKTRRPAGGNYLHIYNLNNLSTFCLSPLLTLSHPKVIRPKTRRSAGENYVHIYKLNKLSTLRMSPLLTLSHPKGDPSEDAPASRGRPHKYLQIYKILDVLHVHDIQMNFGVSVRIGVKRIHNQLQLRKAKKYWTAASRHPT